MTALEKLRAEIMRDDLARFVQGAWHVVEPVTVLQWNWHLDALCAHIQGLVTDQPGPDGQPCPMNLAINVPPGSMKSLIFSVFLLPWVWLRRPTWRALYASGAASVVTRDSLKCREVVKSEWYRKTFQPKWDISQRQDEKHNWQNTATGWRKGVTAGAGVTGERADFLGVDDPNDAADVSSKAHRAQINENWWSSAFQSRIADPSKSKRGLIQQRLHEEDLTGYLLTREKGEWAHLVLQQEFDPKGPGDKPTWLGWRDQRKAGELLMPDRFTPRFLSAVRDSLGSYGYAGQHQQVPAPAVGGRFKREWWRFWAADGVRRERPQGCSQVPPLRWNPAVDSSAELISSWDCTFKDTDGTDFVVGLTIARVGVQRIVLARERARMGLGKTQEAIRRQIKDWPKLRQILVEDKANGSAVIETLRTEFSAIIPVEPLGGKEARAAIMEPRVEAGSWLLPEGAEWLGEWVDEFAGFPLGRHDDQVDAASQIEGRLVGDRDVQRAKLLLSIGL